MELTTRDQLSALWLPWCVEREHPDRPIRIEREPARVAEARQLRIGDLGEEAVRIALANYERDDGQSVLSAIEFFAQVFASEAEQVVLREARLFDTPEGLMLREGTHRSCGLFESGVVDFKIDAPSPEPLTWPDYMHSGLRL